MVRLCRGGLLSINVYASPSIILLRNGVLLRVTVTSLACFRVKSYDQYLPRKCERKPCT